MFQLDKDKISHRWFFLIYSIITLLFTSGILYGWSAILLVFLKEGQYNEFCFMEDGVENCEQQLLKLNRIYTISVITILIAGPIFGFLVDFIKSRACYIISAVVLSIGCTLASFSDSKTFDAWIPAFSCISFGASGVYFSTLPLTQIFKGKEGLAASGFNGAFDSSSVVFILYQTINSFTNWSLKSFFISYNVIPVVVLIMALIIPTDKGTYSDIDMEETKEDKIESKEEESLIKKAPLEYSGQYEHLDFKSVFKVPFFYIQLTLFILTMLWLNMYMGSIEFRMKFLTTNDHDVQNLVIIYSYIMPASIVISPLIGYLLDKKGIFVSMLISQCLLLIWAICVFVPKWPYFQIVSFCMFSCARPFFYSVIFITIPKIFGFNKMGRIFGLFSISGAAITYFQYLFVEITVTKFHGDWLFVNCMQLGCYILNFSYLYFLKKILNTPPPSKN